jgi:hypothetical protein
MYLCCLGGGYHNILLNVIKRREDELKAEYERQQRSLLFKLKEQLQVLRKEKSLSKIDWQVILTHSLTLSFPPLFFSFSLFLCCVLLSKVNRRFVIVSLIVDC